MNARQLQDLLRDALEELIYSRDDGDENPLADLAARTADIKALHTYDDVGMLTTDKGLIIETQSGGELRITIVRVR